MREKQGAGCRVEGAVTLHPAPRTLYLDVVPLGTMAYADALDLQREVARARIAGQLDEDVLLLVEHPPVVTLGRSTKAANVTTPPDALAAMGVELHEVERGGDVTFHGPGQLVGYVVIDLKRHRRDLHWFLRQVEEAIIRATQSFGIPAERSAGLTGVWTRGRKLASIGVHARDWVTWHGFALNVTTDLGYFRLIVPCGLGGVDMTSLARELAPAPVNVDDAARAVTRAFGDVFALQPRDLALDALVARLGATASG